MLDPSTPFDAKGLYSGQNIAVDEAIKSANHAPPVNDDRHCRGALRTDADGIAEFRSVYPGYYVEREIHIHFKVHIGNRAFLTTEAHLPEADNAVALALPPYNLPRRGKRITNARGRLGCAHDETRGTAAGAAGGVGSSAGGVTAAEGKAS